jgi:methylphosphotriester-DNA--protein-cysteine methyltransferase
MQGLRSCFPCTALRPFVRAYAQRWTAVTDLPIVQTTPAQSEQVLEFECGNRLSALYSDGTEYVCSRVELIGPVTRDSDRPYAVQLKLPPGTESFAVFFQPAGFSHLFGVPMCETTNRAYDASSVTGPGIRNLWQMLCENAGFESRVRIVEQFLLGRANRTLTYDKIAGIANYILLRRGMVGVSDLANRGGLGLRQFERTFLTHVGCSPKVFSRVARFQSALDAKVSSPNRSWLELAHEFGYHDQMHMIHDFEKLCGNSPQELLAHLGDMRPPALACTKE